jgi:hypothetical protein
MQKDLKLPAQKPIYIIDHKLQGCRMNIASATGAYAHQITRSHADDTGMRRRGIVDAKDNSRLLTRSDMVEISKESMDRFSQIKNRMHDGFYNSDAVAEAISEKLTDAIEDHS